MVTFRWAYKKFREFARRMKFYRGEIPSSHPAFPEGSAAAAMSTAAGPVAMTAPDIVYTKEDDEAIDRFNREGGESSCCDRLLEMNFVLCISSAGTAWHSVRCLIFLPMCE